ncbi:MAG: hypothetical protein WCG99_04700 [Candidatus Berkelbacteria bacterium]
MPEEKVKKTSVWVWVGVAVIVLVVAAVAIWALTKKDDTTTTETTTEVAKPTVVIPDGWLGFTSQKYHFSLSYPSDYTIAEGPTGTLKFSKAGTELIDMYVYAANGDEDGMMTSTEALYTDDAKGYMIMDAVVQSKVAGITCKTVSGKFGKNAGISQTHEGVLGSTAFFTKNDAQYVFDSYDNGDAVAAKNFTDLLGTISF